MIASWWRRFRAWIADPAIPRSLAGDINDGIIATAGMLYGFASSGATDLQLLRAAAALTIAGALSVGGAKWAEEAAEREAQLRLVEEEKAELEADPDSEIGELSKYWEGKGLTPETARQVAEQLSARDALAAQLESEHGINEVMTPSQPLLSGLLSSMAFLLGSLIPLLITTWLPLELETRVIVLAVVAALVATSFIVSRTGRVSMVRTLVRTLVVGCGTMGISYVAGMLLF